MTSLDGAELVPGRPPHRDHVAALVWSTGPASYAYIFGRRATFDAFVGTSWTTPDRYFGHTDGTVALRGGRVVGVEIGYDGARNYRTKANLGWVVARVARGRRAGCRALHLDVLSDNPAIGFYRARGLETMAQTVAPVPCREHGVPMELRMVTPIEGDDA